MHSGICVNVKPHIWLMWWIYIYSRNKIYQQKLKYKLIFVIPNVSMKQVLVLFVFVQIVNPLIDSKSANNLAKHLTYQILHLIIFF